MTAGQAAAFLRARLGEDVAEIAAIGRSDWSWPCAFRRGEAHDVARFGACLEDLPKDRLAARYASPALPIPTVPEVGEAFDAYHGIPGRAFGGYVDLSLCSRSDRVSAGAGIEAWSQCVRRRV